MITQANALPPFSGYRRFINACKVEVLNPCPFGVVASVYGNFILRSSEVGKQKATAMPVRHRRQNS
jgi:hypothetical protein